LRSRVLAPHGGSRGGNPARPQVTLVLSFLGCLRDGGGCFLARIPPRPGHLAGEETRERCRAPRLERFALCGWAGAPLRSWYRHQASSSPRPLTSHPRRLVPPVPAPGTAALKSSARHRRRSAHQSSHSQVLCGGSTAFAPCSNARTNGRLIGQLITANVVGLRGQREALGRIGKVGQANLNRHQK
jgi:hypothetical protein